MGGKTTTTTTTRRMASRVRGARFEVRGKMEEGKINCQYVNIAIERQERVGFM